MLTSNLGISKPDLIILIFILLCCILGFLKGVIRQFFSIIAFVLATIISIGISCFLDLPFGSESSPVWGYIILSVLIWIPSFIILNIAGKFIAGRMSKGRMSVGDRLWGFLFGGIKGFIILVLIIFFIDMLPAGVKNLAPEAVNFTEGSKIITAVEPYNPFLKLHIMENLQIMLSVLNDPDYMDLLKNDPGWQKLRKQESIQEVLNDPQLRDIITQRQFLKFFTNPKIQGLIKDQEAMKLLLTTDIDKAVISQI